MMSTSAKPCPTIIKRLTAMFAMLLAIALCITIVGDSVARESVIDALRDDTLPHEELSALIADMSLHEKVCQMIIVRQQELPLSNGKGYVEATETGSKLKKALDNYPVGGLLYDENNIKSMKQIEKLLRKANGYSEIPLFLTISEEGGSEATIGNLIGYSTGTTVGPEMDYETQGEGIARSNAITIALNLSKLGFNMDLAPTANITYAMNNPNLGERAYSSDPEIAAKLISAAVSGYHLGGVNCAMKYFPGDGLALSDGELQVFQSGIDAGADAILVNASCLFSDEVINQLRNDMEFSGLVVSEDLSYLSDVYETEYLVVSAVKAGADVLMCPDDLPAAVKAIENAVASGEISEERIDESIWRIMMAKYPVGEKDASVITSVDVPEDIIIK